jgi:hypothetical protein
MKFKIAATLGLLATVGLAIPSFVLAQGAQHNETDIAFIKRITTRLQRIESDAERLDDYVKDLSRRESANQAMEQDQYGRQQHTPARDRESELRRAGSKMRTNRRKAEKERDRLVEMQRAGSSIDPEEREKIETAVSRMERDIAELERDIRMGRF